MLDCVLDCEDLKDVLRNLHSALQAWGACAGFLSRGVMGSDLSHRPITLRNG